MQEGLHFRWIWSIREFSHIAYRPYPAFLRRPYRAPLAYLGSRFGSRSDSISESAAISWRLELPQVADFPYIVSM
jgi:hypothetical protein